VGVFCFGGVGCSALRTAQGALTPPWGTKHLHLLFGINFQELRIKNYVAIFTFLFDIYRVLPVEIAEKI